MVHDRPDDEDDREGEDRTPADEPIDDRDPTRSDDGGSEDDAPRDEQADRVREPDSLGRRLGERLERLLEFLDESEDRRRSLDGPGSRRTPASSRISVDTDVSIGSLGDSDREPRSRTQFVRTSDDEYLTSVQREGEDLVVVADLPGVEFDELSVGVDADSEQLVIAVDDDPIERISLSREAVGDVDARYNNYVLEVRVPGGGTGESEDEVTSP